LINTGSRTSRTRGTKFGHEISLGQATSRKLEHKIKRFDRFGVEENQLTWIINRRSESIVQRSVKTIDQVESGYYIRSSQPLWNNWKANWPDVQQQTETCLDVRSQPPRVD
jgi:hypothetical protein